MKAQRLLRMSGWWIRTFLPFAWAAVSALLLFWFFHDWGFDDPYITFRYARNIASGTGFVYNPGEHVLSTTTPLYALILALVHRVGLDIPLWSNIIGCASLGLGGLALWNLGNHWQTPIAGMVAMILFPISTLLNTTLGSETVVYIAFILYGFLACVRTQYILAAVFFALATLLRADAIVAAGIAGLYVLVAQWDRQSWRSLPWRALVVYGLLLVPWGIFAGIYFGNPLPVTLAAKQQQLFVPGARDFFGGLVVRLTDQWHNEMMRWNLLLAVVGLGALPWLRPQWLLVVGWGVLYSAAYTILGVASYFWYYAPVTITLVVLIALGIEAVYVFLRRLPGTYWQAVVVALLVGVAIMPQVSGFLAIKDWVDSRLEIYRDVGIWLRQNTEPDASIEALEVGIIRYYSERRIIDIAGLIQPEVAQRLSAGGGYDDTAWWAFHHFRPTHLVLQDKLFRRLEQDPTFQEQCQRIRVFTVPAYTYPLVVYACLTEEE
jgi:hypothetical protein